MSNLYETFADMDTDHSGSLERSELQRGEAISLYFNSISALFYSSLLQFAQFLPQNIRFWRAWADVERAAVQCSLPQAGCAFCTKNDELSY